MKLYVDKDTDLMRSTFVAIGLANLLYRIPPSNSGQEVTITDMGSCFVVDSTWDATQLIDAIEKIGFLPALLPAIIKPLTAKEKKLLEAGTSQEELELKYKPRGFAGEQIDYGAEKKRADEAKKYRPPKGEVRSIDDEPRAHPDFPMWAHLASYFGKGSAMRVGYPSVIHTWHAHHEQKALDLFDTILFCYEDFPNRLNESSQLWQEEIDPSSTYADFELRPELSTLAAVSPSTSKGTSAVSGFNMLAEDTPNTFWLEMYLAFSGFMLASLPYTIGSDVVTYYPLIGDISFKALQNMMGNYRKKRSAWTLYRNSNSMNRAKLDVLSSILFYKEMIAHLFDTYDEDTEIIEGLALDAIKGLVGYYYKDISTQIPFDETIFARPAWLSQSATAEELEGAIAVLEVHYRLINSLRGVKFKLTSDELKIIEHYRKYTTRGDAMDWLGFAITYGQYRFRKMTDFNYPPLELDVFIRSFPMSNLNSDRVDYTEILEAEGFQNIASAISYCTGYARYMRDVKNDRTFPYRVWHGLGDDLLRNSHNAEQFLTDLSKFVHRYRNENQSVQANTGKNRQEIQSEDIQAIVALVAKYGSNIVAHLLVASGYSVRFGRDDK